MTTGIVAIDAVVFDFDGLILDTEVPVFTAWRAAFESHGCEPPTIEEWSTWIGTDADDSALVEQLVAGAPGSVDVAAMHDARRIHRDSLLAAEVVRPGVLAWIEEAKAGGLGVAIASSSPAEWVLRHLDRLALRDRFDPIVCAGPGLAGEPAPDTYRSACRTLGVEPGRALAVEDSPNGVAAAKAAGLRCVTVPNPITALLDVSGADLRLGSLADCSLAAAVARIDRMRSMR